MYMSSMCIYHITPYTIYTILPYYVYTLVPQCCSLLLLDVRCIRIFIDKPYSTAFGNLYSVRNYTFILYIWTIFVTVSRIYIMR